jgi:hypothetical protein
MRWVWRLLGMALLAFFGVAGVWMTLAAETTFDRAMGIAVVLMSAACGFVYLVLFRRQPEGALRIALDTAVDPPQRALQVPMRGVKWVGTTLALFAMAAACGIIGIYAESVADAYDSPLFIRVMGFGGFVLFGFIGGAPLLSLRYGAPRVVATEETVAMIGGAAPFAVPWDAVEQIGHWEVTVRGHGQRFVGLRVRDRAAIRRPTFSRLLMLGSRSMSGWDLTLAEQTFDLTAEELATILRGLHANPLLRRAVASLPDGDLSYEQLMLQTGGDPSR